jgi:hypothetical protein
MGLRLQQGNNVAHHVFKGTVSLNSWQDKALGCYQGPNLELLLFFLYFSDWPFNF